MKKIIFLLICFLFFSCSLKNEETEKILKKDEKNLSFENQENYFHFKNDDYTTMVSIKYWDWYFRFSDNFPIPQLNSEKWFFSVWKSKADCDENENYFKDKSFNLEVCIPKKWYFSKWWWRSDLSELKEFDNYVSLWRFDYPIWKFDEDYLNAICIKDCPKLDYIPPHNWIENLSIHYNWQIEKNTSYSYVVHTRYTPKIYENWVKWSYINALQVDIFNKEKIYLYSTFMFKYADSDRIFTINIDLKNKEHKRFLETLTILWEPSFEF